MKRSSLTTKSPISLRTTCTSSISLWLYLQGAHSHENSFQAAQFPEQHVGLVKAACVNRQSAPHADSATACKS